ncbi:TSUP family transporter [Amorphus sp. 3PC139-8]|uniref:TSUP family transporter n=1 Tax=Amorphus sp. 3PC139-8 TaxID=2735676 RepID=UPI00345CDF1E
MSWQVFVAGCAIAAFAAAIRRMTGFGFAMVMVSLLTLMIGPTRSVLVALFLQLVLSARNVNLIVNETRWHFLPWMLGAGFLAIPVGLAIVSAVDEPTLRILVGVAVLSALVPLVGEPRPLEPSWQGGAVSGFCAGILNILAAMPGPPLLLYLMRLKDVSLEARRATLITVFTLLTVAALTGHLVAGGVDRASLLLAVGLSPAAVIGDIVGRRSPWSMNRRIIDILSIAIVILAAAILVLSGAFAYVA